MFASEETFALHYRRRLDEQSIAVQHTTAAVDVTAAQLAAAQVAHEQPWPPTRER